MSPTFTMSDADNAAFASMHEEIVTPPIETEGDPEGSPEGAETETEVEQPEGAPPVKKPSMVPHQALHEEREQRKAAQAELQKFREERAALNERMRIVQELNAPRQQAEQIPDPEQDPIGAMKYLLDQQRQQSQQTQQQRQQSEQQSQQNQQFNQFMNSYKAQADAYAKDTPEFTKAYNFLSENRLEELMEAGYDAATANAMLRQDEANIVWQAQQQGKNPAAVLHKMAKLRGWKAEEPTADNEAGKEVTKRVENTARAVSTNKSLASAGGAAGATEMTVEALIKMSPKEFEAWGTKHPAKMKALMGG